MPTPPARPDRAPDRARAPSASPMTSPRTKPTTIVRADRDDEAVRRQREHEARLAHAAQVDEHEHTSTPRLSSTACDESSGTAEVTASTPEAIETAAVST